MEVVSDLVVMDSPRGLLFSHDKSTLVALLNTSTSFSLFKGENAIIFLVLKYKIIYLKAWSFRNIFIPFYEKVQA